MHVKLSPKQMMDFSFATCEHVAVIFSARCKTEEAGMKRGSISHNGSHAVVRLELTKKPGKLDGPESYDFPK